MKMKIIKAIFLSIISLCIQAATLEQTLPIKNGWSIISRGDKVFIRFKGCEDAGQIVQYANIGNLQIRDLETWNIIQEFENIQFVTESFDAHYIAILYGDETAQIIDLQNNIILKEIFGVKSLYFSDTGYGLKIVTQDSTQFINTQSMESILVNDTIYYPGLAFAVHKDYFAAATKDGAVQIISSKTGVVIKEFDQSTVQGLDFSEDGNNLLVTYSNDQAAFLHMDSFKEISRFDDSKLLFFAPGDIYFVRKTSNNTLQIINRNDLSVKLELPKNVFSGFSNNNNYVWHVSEDNLAQVIDIRTSSVIIDNLCNIEECSFTATSDKIIIMSTNQIDVYSLIEN